MAANKTNAKGKAKPAAGKAKGKATSGKARTKSETFQALADKTGLKRKQIQQVFDELTQLIRADLGDANRGVFVLPGLLKIKRVHKPATEEKVVPDRFHPGQMMTVKAKPERSIVKPVALKNLKDMVK